MRSGKIDMAKLRHHAQRVRLRSARAGQTLHTRFFSSPKRVVISIAALLVVPIILVQLFYPWGNTLPNMTVGSVKLGAVSKDEALRTLNDAYTDAKVSIYFTDSEEVVVEPTLSDLGFTISNEKRVDAYSYPFGMRLMPWSLFWYQSFVDKGEPEVNRNDETLAAFVKNRFGEDCKFAPQDGTIAYKEGELQVIDAARGGSCDNAELTAKLEKVTPQLTPEKVIVTGASTAPEVSTETAQAEFTRLTKQLEEGISLKVEDNTETIPKDVAEQWIAYTVKDAKLVLGFNKNASKWLLDTYGEKFTSQAGTTIVTTKDFAEVSREKGKNGQSLNTKATINEMVKELKGEAESAKLIVDTTAPKITYKRSYSSTNTGLSAVMKNYADTHAGTYGVKMIELSGARRNAEYNSTTQFTTASTYKLFVAYSTLLRIERGEWHWTDQIHGGRNASKCFDDMIKLSDNECAIAFLKKIDYRPITNEAHAIGATSTSFLGSNGIKSTAKDEALLLSLLYSGQILSQQSSRDKWINAMKQNVYRQGIPTGIPGVVVADKVGFLYGLLHDAAIVYSPKGAYVLVILTDNASWANIAELTKEIEAVR